MAQLQPEETKRVVITQAVHGICYMQVCAVADVTDEEVLDVANRENPSGTQRGWVRVIREQNEHRQGPVVCDRFPERLHLLLEC